MPPFRILWHIHQNDGSCASESVEKVLGMNQVESGNGGITPRVVCAHFNCNDNDGMDNVTH
jgi:hypothetical protein